MLPCAATIKTLFKLRPPPRTEEIRAASLQFVRKLSGFTAPSRANEAAFDLAVDEVSAVARRLIDSLDDDGGTQGPRGGSGAGEGARRPPLPRRRVH